MAFFHDPGEGKTAVMPPKELREPGVVWFLEKAMNGTRAAAKLFGSYVIDSLQKAGLQPIVCMPMTFVHTELEIEVAVHGDDFVAEGVKESLDKLDEIMEQYFDVKRLPRIGPPEYGGETTAGDHLKCTIAWTRSGFTWEGNPKHVKDLFDLMGFDETTKGVDTPSVKESGKGVRSALDELNARDVALFRSAAGTLQYIAQDMIAIKQATAEVMQGMAVPLQVHQLRLARVTRYLIKYPGEVWHYDYQDNPGVLDEICDSDWAGDVVTRKSVSCIIERFGKHILDCTVNKQKTIALSSGEAEFYPIVKAGAQSIQSQSTLVAFGHGEVHIKIWSDSSAARGIVQRQGPGKLRHLDIKDLWIQEFIRLKKAEVLKILTDVNWADVGTKALAKSRLEELLAMMPITRREGLEWVVKASTALAFLAGLDMAEAGLPYGLVVQTQPKSEVDTTAHNEAKFKLRYLIALAVCVVTVHMLAASNGLQLRRRLTGATPSVGLDDDSDCGGKQPKSVLHIRMLKTYCLTPLEQLTGRLLAVTWSVWFKASLRIQKTSMRPEPQSSQKGSAAGDARALTG